MVVIGDLLGVYPAMYRVWILGEPGVGLLGESLDRIPPYPFWRFGLASIPILGGAWAGYFLHKKLNEALASGSPEEQSATDSASQQPKKSDQPDQGHDVFPCPTCGQKLRVPKVQEELTVTCPKCRGKFRHSASEARATAGADTLDHRIPLLAGLIGLFIALLLVDRFVGGYADGFARGVADKVAEGSPPSNIREKIVNDALRQWAQSTAEASDTFIERIFVYPLPYLIGTVLGAAGSYIWFSGYKLFKSRSDESSRGADS